MIRFLPYRVNLKSSFQREESRGDVTTIYVESIARIAHELLEANEGSLLHLEYAQKNLWIRVFRAVGATFFGVKKTYFTYFFLQGLKNKVGEGKMVTAHLFATCFTQFIFCKT